MGWSFETLGNAIVQIFKDDVPQLITDPWLAGSAYFGSWELERPLNERQLLNARTSPFIWYSHGHPDHFHPGSFDLLSRDSLVLLPDHYDQEMARALAENGFRYRILPQKRWVDLTPGLRVLCVANENMDAILAIEAGGVLIIDKNDSPLCGEDRFFRRLVSSYKQSFLLALCAFDADMINTYDAGMRPLIGPPEERKPGTIWSVGRTAEYLGAKVFCCSSSQHVYARPDSAWANDYRIVWADMQTYWASRTVRLVGPYMHVDMRSGEAHATEPPPDRLDAADRVCNPQDDWDARLSEQQWQQVEAFARQFETLRTWQDFVAFTVGGETRRYLIRDPGKRKSADRLVGANFHLPKQMLMDTVEYGYFDDLLIGNVMKTQLFNMQLYPHFSPLVAKLGGNAKVLTHSQLWKFRWHFFRSSPRAFLRYRLVIAWRYYGLPYGKLAARRLGIFGVLKRLRAGVIGGPRAAPQSE